MSEKFERPPIEKKSYSILDGIVTPRVRKIYPYLHIPVWFNPKLLIFAGQFFAILASFCLANIPEYSGLGFVAAFSVVLNYFFDLIDGHHARTTNQCTNSGEFLDTTLDNLTYCFLFMGLAVAANMWFLGMLITYCFFITAMAGKYRRDLFRKTTIGYFGPAEIRTIFIMISLIMVYEPSVVFYLVPLFTIITMLGSLRQIFKISKEIDSIETRDRSQWLHNLCDFKE